jgi:hypothetical protein
MEYSTYNKCSLQMVKESNISNTSLACNHLVLLVCLFSSSLHKNICDHDDIREVLETGVDLKACTAWVANNSGITPMALGNRCFGIVVQLQLGYIFFPLMTRLRREASWEHTLDLSPIFHLNDRPSPGAEKV